MTNSITAPAPVATAYAGHASSTLQARAAQPPVAPLVPRGVVVANAVPAQQYGREGFDVTITGALGSTTIFTTGQADFDSALTYRYGQLERAGAFRRQPAVAPSAFQRTL